MMQYYRAPGQEVFRPDRRHHQVHVRDDRRRVDPTRITSEQIDIIRNGLRDLVSIVAGMYYATRRMRHLAFGLSIVSLVLVLALWSPAMLAGSRWNAPLSAVVGYAVPLVLSYLILYATRTTTTRRRLNHRRWFIETQLNKFGFPTAYGIAREHQDWIEQKDHEARHKKAIKYTRIAANAYDVLLALVVVSGLAASIGLGLLADYASTPAWVERLLSLLICLSAGLAIGAVVVFALSRTADEELAVEFMNQSEVWRKFVH